MPDISQLEAVIGYKFNNKEILQEALTHRSYLNEHPSWKVHHNERLEFLGDAALEIVISEYLYKKYPKKPEGDLTSFRASLVNYLFLSRVARGIGLEHFLYLSKGEAKDSEKARDVILANAIEALIGAMYLDGGLEQVGVFAKKFIAIHLDEIISKELYKDAKSLLQEYSQEKLKLTPAYNLIEEWGPDHKKNFRMGVYLGSKLIAEGEGPSKQEAELDAARKAVNVLKTA